MARPDRGDLRPCLDGLADRLDPRRVGRAPLDRVVPAREVGDIDVERRERLAERERTRTAAGRQLALEQDPEPADLRAGRGLDRGAVVVVGGVAVREIDAADRFVDVAGDEHQPAQRPGAVAARKVGEQLRVRMAGAEREQDRRRFRHQRAVRQHQRRQLAGRVHRLVGVFGLFEPVERDVAQLDRGADLGEQRLRGERSGVRVAVENIAHSAARAFASPFSSGSPIDFRSAVEGMPTML